ncbi:MAG TPA: DUF1801 domain-containing protein [Jiangellaceae bacterium]
MAELKTSRHDGDVGAFLDAIPDDQRRADARAVCELMARVADRPPAMWGTSIVGFGERHLRYASGRELDWFDIGFSPRRRSLTLYVTEGFEGYDDLLERLGAHTTGVSCLYLRRLSDVDAGVLEEIVTRSVAHVRA